MELLFKSVKHFLLEHGIDKTYCLALSGGLDSSVLLDLLAKLRELYPFTLHAVHIHHGLSVHADSWAMHCQKLCAERNIPLTQLRVDAKTMSGESPEEVARECRYAALAQSISPNDILLTAHHQDDQAETVLSQLIRGAGPQGLAAMPRFIAFHSGFHGRPLLDFSRAILHEYAVSQQLTWVDDESNANVNFTRNFLRHEVMPLLKSRWPQVTQTMARVADHCAEAQHVLDIFIQQDLENCYGTELNTVSVKKLLLLSVARQRLVLRLWLKQRHFPLPSTIKLQHIMQDLLHAEKDKSPHIVWANVEMRRYQDNIYLLHCLPAYATTECYEWDLMQPLMLAENKRLQAIVTQGQGLRVDITQVTVRFRQGGEKIQLPGRTHSHALKKLFQTWGVPPWLRDRIPLLFVGDELVAVVGWVVAEAFVAREGEQGRLVTWIE